MKSRILVLCFVFLVFLGTVVSKAVLYAAGPQSEATMKVSGVQPRQVEEETQQAISKEYAKAWQTLARALKENRADLLQEDFLGAAQQKFASQIEQQKAAGFSTNYVDHGHKIDVLFYSPEGSAIQFRDTASLEVQILQGGKLVHSENTLQEYVGLLTVSESGWKVRVLQAAK